MSPVSDIWWKSTLFNEFLFHKLYWAFFPFRSFCEFFRSRLFTGVLKKKWIKHATYDLCPTSYNRINFKERFVYHTISENNSQFRPLWPVITKVASFKKRCWLTKLDFCFTCLFRDFLSTIFKVQKLWRLYLWVIFW